MTVPIDAAGTLPTPAEEARFWALIESAWAEVGPQPLALRRALIEGDPDGSGDDNAELYAIEAWLDPLLDRLRRLSVELSAQELTDLDRVVERKLHDIDREDIHEVTDGSDDGFLYCRGFIVALGREYYESVRADPARALIDAECEALCYFFAHLHNELFGTWPETGSGISRESCSNPVGWSDWAGRDVEERDQA
ncbi:DUF4240 domain-containing protein [Micromonospora sp. DT201]|uniref:DUF4240 domain-containing protein n=1 Tax=Micromonospora TaxID=1873 RepID=UPI0033E9867D